MEKINQQVEDKKGFSGSVLFKMVTPPVKGYTIVPNWLIEHRRLSNDAFRRWCYLLSRPDNWILNDTDLKKRLPMSEYALKKAHRELKQRKLLKRIIQKRPNNTFANNGFVISNTAIKDQEFLDFMDKINTNSKYRWNPIGSENPNKKPDGRFTAGRQDDPLSITDVNNGYPNLTEVLNNTLSYPKKERATSSPPSLSVSNSLYKGASPIPEQRSTSSVLDGFRGCWQSYEHHSHKLNYPRKASTDKKFLQAADYFLSRYSASLIEQKIDEWAKWVFATENLGGKLWRKTLWDLVTDKKGNLGRGGELIIMLEKKPQSRLNRKLAEERGQADEQKAKKRM